MSTDARQPWDAYLHRVEGDEGNARIGIRRRGGLRRKSLEDEWKNCCGAPSFERKSAIPCIRQSANGREALNGKSCAES
jgi:hypothetical protein